jgi:hypothetical protein
MSESLHQLIARVQDEELRQKLLRAAEREGKAISSTGLEAPSKPALEAPSKPAKPYDEWRRDETMCTSHRAHAFEYSGKGRTHMRCVYCDEIFPLAEGWELVFGFGFPVKIGESPDD